ncbi:MAG: RNA methyltransferase [Vallitaleaceae bacterium]|nr:RNA methyltransferase [Vallitaleaceae bacterium]
MMITSLQNTKVKNVCALNGKQKLRNEEGLFIVEGKKMLEECPAARVVEVYAIESFWKENSVFMERFDPSNCFMVSEAVLKQMSDVMTPQGILGVIRQSRLTFEALVWERPSLFIALENLQDPGNVGTIIRTAEAVNATGVFLSKGSVDIYNPKIVRSTMGSIFRVPIVENVDLTQVVLTMKQKQVKVYAAHLEGSQFYDDFQYYTDTCFLIGNEGSGLTKTLTELASDRVKIPLLGQSESLNASIAAGVLLYEVIRQRRKK